MECKPKPRPLVLDAHVIAYLGDYMNNFKKSITRMTKEAINTQKLQAQTQSAQSNTASARNRS